ncbi:MAG: isoaspartyl peptidase/L-asparaginase [Bacteroidales bacterium]|nr:isoaspartyl peptidase/L-asparaginase [Bacteroidales bacterium]
MKPIYAIVCLSTLLFVLLPSCKQPNRSQTDTPSRQQPAPGWALVLHGGAGNLHEEAINSELEAQYIASLQQALDAGKKVLSEGGAALDAVETVIRMLEDNPLFNAGKGAAFTHDGRNELDASIMDGATLKAGAVAVVTDIKNPITAARAVMERSMHVMLSGTGASQFAREQGLEIVNPEYFRTDRKWNDLQELINKEKHGTVGCVALDGNGNLAAGTSTGGMANKRYNRIGDSPVIGAGTYASNATCAISCTGHGEYFIRYAVAHDISALMEYKGISVEEAAKQVVLEKLVKAGGEGGVIGIDRLGNITMTFNTPGMFRAYAKADGKQGVYIFRDGK